MQMILGNVCLWNGESWTLESGIQLEEYRTALLIVIHIASSTDKDWNSVPRIWIHGVESRIQDCLEYSRTLGRNIIHP